MIIQEPVQATIWFTLNHYAYNDAIFLAERLHSEVNSEESLYLLATCYYRAGKEVSAYSILKDKGFKSSECRLLLARCCCDLKKFAEAEEALIGKLKQSKPALTTDDLYNDFNEAASFAAQLLGYICSKTERYAKALDYYKKSLKLNPFLWSSFEGLVQLGSKVDPSKIFNINNVDFELCYGSNPLINLWNSSTKTADNVITSQSQHNQQQQTNSGENVGLNTNITTGIKDVNQTFEIRSPFAVIKPHSETGTYEVITPDNNCWVSTTCQAPQKVSNVVEVKSIKKIGSDHNTPLVVSKSDTPAGRLSFGVFPLGDTPTLSLCNSVDSTGNIESNNSKPSSVADVDNVSTKIPNAPSKKPATRRSQQNSAFMPSSARNNFPKLQIFNQTVNINTQSIDSGITSLQSSPSVTNQISSVQQTGPGLRRSIRLFNSSSSVKENSKATARTTNQENNKKATGSKTPTKKTRKTTSSGTTATSNVQQKESELNDINKPELSKPSTNFGLNEELKSAGLKWQKASAEGLLNLLAEFGRAALYLGQFQCQKAIDVLSDLPLKHYNTGWVLTALGKAYFEMAKYDEAVKFFEDAHKSEPHRLQGTEYYSTALWHLQQEVKLSMLAQELIEFDKNSPQTWCVAGNCFSLQKEHETGIKFLQRAIQVDPDFAYAYTLLGHELVLTEEMDHAMACFRNAIRIDPRHYNAWYGIGMIYYKQEKYQLAELHYRKALQISPCNPVLMCHIGVVQHALNKTELALQTLNKAIEMDPKNALCKFHRASIYFAMDKHQMALNELEELKQIVPKESLVYFLIGKVHKRLGTTHLALMNFSWAMDLDPKGANNQIKEVIDKQYANDEDDVVICLDSGDEVGNSTATSSQAAVNLLDSDSSLPLRSALDHESSSSMEAEEEQDFGSSEVMDEGI